MKKCSILLTLIFSAALSCSHAAENRQELGDIPQIWTEKKAVAFAFAGNPDSTIALKRIEEARATASMVGAADYPLINISAQYRQTDNPMYSFGNILNQGTFNNSIDFNDPGRTDDLQLQAMVKYRIYNGGRDQAAGRSARAGIAVAQTNLTAVHHQLGFEVVKTFQAIIQAEKMVTVRSEALNAINAAFRVGKARYDAGDLLRQDLLNLELQQSRASENLIKSKHVLALTKRSFLNLLGLRKGKVVIDASSGSEQKIPDSFTYDKRYELKRLDAQEEAARAELARARGGNLPTVDTFASYQWDKGWVIDGDGDSWMAGIRVDYTLFDGKRTQSQIARAKTKLLEIQGIRKKTELALHLEIERARLDYEQAKKRVGVTEKMVGVAEEVARLSRARFKEGVILASDLIDFEMRLSDARARHLAAKASYRIAIASLRKATGLKQFSAQDIQQ